MLRNDYKILTIFIGIQLLVFHASFAQVKVQVVSQKFIQSLEWKPGMSLQLSGERAEIFCTTHALNTIEFEVTFISKHENKTVAEGDLNKMKWINEKMGNKIFLRNYIELTRNEEKPQSDIKAIYHIQIPTNCAVDIKNYFGIIKLENITSEFKITSEFSKIELKNILGKGSVKTTFGDINGQNILGDIRIESNRSDIDLLEIGGNLSIYSVLAELYLKQINENSKLSINAEKSNVKLSVEELNQYQFKFDLTKIEFELPEILKSSFVKNDKDEINASFIGEKSHSQIDVKLNIGTLIIK